MTREMQNVKYETEQLQILLTARQRRKSWGRGVKFKLKFKVEFKVKVMLKLR